MTLTDALKTGLNFKRSGWATWYKPMEHSWTFDATSLQATDWVTDAQTVTITRAQALTAWTSAKSNFDTFAKLLGFT